MKLYSKLYSILYRYDTVYYTVTISYNYCVVQDTLMNYLFLNCKFPHFVPFTKL